jgi:hypothetical protein
MKQQVRMNWISATGLLLSMPAAFFIFISMLKEWLGINGPYDSVQPVLESWGISETIGWNINLLILLGPLAGILLSSTQLVKWQWHNSPEDVRVNISFRKKWFPILVLLFSATLLGILVLYLLGENCSCY